MSLKLAVMTFFLVQVAPLAVADQHLPYSAGLLQSGKQLFQTHCAGCHGLNAQGITENWRQPDANGKFPAPPLNGTAHTWHHPLGSLFYTIKNGTLAIGGSMPPWENKLSDEEILSVIFWLTSLWPEEIYDAWMQRNNE